MTIGDPSTLDADDCLAQMILHELLSLVDRGGGQPRRARLRPRQRKRARHLTRARLSAPAGLAHRTTRPPPSTRPHHRFPELLRRAARRPVRRRRGPGDRGGQAGRGAFGKATLGPSSTRGPAGDCKGVKRRQRLRRQRSSLHQTPDLVEIARIIRRPLARSRPRSRIPLAWHPPAPPGIAPPLHPKPEALATEINHISRLDQTFRCLFGGCSSGGMAVQPKGEMSNG